MEKEIIREENKMHEILVSYSRPVYDHMPKVNCSQDVDKIIRKAINGLSLDYQEYFWCLYLNNANKVLGYCEISSGDSTGTIVNIPKIFAVAVNVSAKGLIIIHNHPSGNLKASEKDKVISERIKFLASLFSMTLLDSLIITSESYLSFSDEAMFLESSNTLPF